MTAFDLDDDAAFVASRRALHVAVQPVAAAGLALAPAQHDDGHSTLSWDNTRGALLGEPLRDGLRAGVLVGDFALAVFDAQGQEQGRLSLEGRALGEAYGWLGERLGGALEPPPYAMPVWSADVAGALDVGAARDAVARWISAAQALLSMVVAGRRGASRVRLWPHHFDVACLVQLNARPARSINVGMVLGDETIVQPYWYVTPWPCPDDRDVDDLSIGRWHDGSWFGAVLEAQAIVAAYDGEAVVRRFVQEAMAATTELLDV